MLQRSYSHASTLKTRWPSPAYPASHVHVRQPPCQWATSATLYNLPRDTVNIRHIPPSFHIPSFFPTPTLPTSSFLPTNAWPSSANVETLQITTTASTITTTTTIIIVNAPLQGPLTTATKHTTSMQPSFDDHAVPASLAITDKLLPALLHIHRRQSLTSDTLLYA